MQVYRDKHNEATPRTSSRLARGTVTSAAQEHRTAQRDARTHARASHARRQAGRADRQARMRRKSTLSAQPLAVQRAEQEGAAVPAIADTDRTHRSTRSARHRTARRCTALYCTAAGTISLRELPLPGHQSRGATTRRTGTRTAAEHTGAGRGQRHDAATVALAATLTCPPPRFRTSLLPRHRRRHHHPPFHHHRRRPRPHRH